MADVTPGKQYVAVACRNCGQQVLIAEVDQGTELGNFAWGEFDVACVHCGHEASYPVSELRMMTVQILH